MYLTKSYRKEKLLMMNTNDKWMQKYQKLKEYQKEHGNIDVPQSYEKDGIKLGIWLNNQRQAYKGIGTGKITEEQIKLLNDLGIKWQVRDERWNDYYQLLKEYQEEHGNIDVPYFYEKDGMKLGVWLRSQRLAYKGIGTGRITEEQIELLNYLGIKWQVRDETWNRYYQLLKGYQEEHGNIDVPYFYEKNGMKLGVWLSSQRQAYKGIGTGKITEEQIKLLNDLGIKWQVRDERWNDYYQLLKEYQEEHGNIDVPYSYKKNEMKLGVWLRSQRLAYKGIGTGKITEEQIELLNDLEMNWQVRDEIWNRYYQLLKEYQEKHGNIDVPYAYKKNEMKLGVWLRSQRLAYKGIGTGKITEEQIELLNDLGMNWQIRDKIWNRYYQLLKEYQEEHGNIDVPQHYEKDGMKLGKWLSAQRQAYKGIGTNKITEEQIELLNHLRIKWQVRDETWNRYYQLLKEYQEKHGNIDVPQSYEKDGIKLGIWLRSQRRAYKEIGTGKITEEQIELLNHLGMKWQIRDKIWNDYYQLLKEYQEKHGNIDVPRSYEKDGMKLGKWLSAQRQAYKGIGTNKITEEQIKLLNHLGIKWQVRDEIWNDYYQLLKEYQEKHGNIDVPQSYEKDGIKLGIWLGRQRQAYKEIGTGKISKKQIELLNHLGIKWQVRDEIWNRYYQLLKEYQEEYGNIDVPRSYEKDEMKLGIWLGRQRQAYKGIGTYKITKKQIELLNHLGMKWQIRDERWNRYYQLLKEYQEEHGNIDVPSSYEKDEMKLGIWLGNQRRAYKGIGTYKITEEQIELLNHLGIKWQVRDEIWNRYYQLLKEYQEEHGNIDVPQHYEKDGMKLGVWLSTKRQAYKGIDAGKITEEQIQLLNELGIDWNILHTRFLNREITTENQEKYQQILLDRVNHIVDDLLLEGFSEMDATNQQEIEKVMIKRIWR